MVVVAVGTEDMCALASSSDSDEPARFAAELTAQRKDLEALREAWSHGPHSKREVIPSRAWPDVQPEADELPALLSAKALCDAARAKNGSAGVTKEGSKKEEELACARVTFDLGTALLGLPDRQEEGALLYKELAEAKFPDGMTGWGICLMEARGVSEDAPLACRWFESAAASASATTAGKKAAESSEDERAKLAAVAGQPTYELAVAYYQGVGVEENEETAADLFLKAAAVGHTGGLYMAGDCLLEGIGCTKDRSRALKLLRRAGEQGHRGARSRLLAVIAPPEPHTRSSGGTDVYSYDAEKYTDSSRQSLVVRR